MRKVYNILLVIALIIIGGISSNVNAEVKENTFTNEKCITETDWQNNAYSEYKLNKENGVFEPAGNKYSQIENKNLYNIYYEVSEDGKTLYAYVPDYQSKTSTENIKNELYKKGIITSDSCEETYKVEKTVVGALGLSKSDEQKENNTIQTPSNDNNNKKSEKSDTKKSEELVQKVNAPNTASPLKISIIIIVIALFVAAIYSVLKRYNILPNRRSK